MRATPGTPPSKRASGSTRRYAKSSYWSFVASIIETTFGSCIGECGSFGVSLYA